MSESDGQKRLCFLDIAKGINIITIMMSHVDAFPNILIFGVRLEYISYSFFIAVFFVASGYTFTNHGSVSDNIKRRFKKLIIPYFLYSLLLFFICLVKDIITGKISLAAIVRAVEGIAYSRAWLYSRDFGPENTVPLFTIYNGTMWFLTAMFLASVVFYMMNCQVKCATS